MDLSNSRGMSNRAGFWHQPKAPSEDSRVQRTESIPNRERNGSTEWLDTQSRTSATNHGFTPFKSVKGQNEATPAEMKPKADPFQYSPTAFHRDQPQSQSTPKNGGSRSGTAVPRVPTIPRVPPPHHYRSVSAMGQPAMGSIQRPPSRASEAPMHTMNSRYHSYTTLPRPEQTIDPYRLDEQHQYYAGQYYYPGPQPRMIISRPPSTIPPPSLGVMPTEYGQMGNPMHPSPPQPYPPPTTTTLTQSNPNASLSIRKPTEIMSWNALSLLCSLLVLCALAIFGLGVFRMLQHAKWAIGVELAYAISVLFSGLIGISSIRSRSHCAAAFAYGLSGVNCLLSAVPFLLGMLPLVPYGFPEVDPRLVINKHEPIEIDLGMSLIVGVSCLVSFLMVLYGCRALGNACRAIEGLKVRAEMDTSFGVEPLPVKQ